MEKQLSRIWFELTKGLTIMDIQAEFQSILEIFFNTNFGTHYPLYLCSKIPFLNHFIHFTQPLFRVNNWVPYQKYLFIRNYSLPSNWDQILVISETENPLSAFKNIENFFFFFAKA